MSVEINATNFPGGWFRSYVSNNFDTDHDGWLSDEEIAAVTVIDFLLNTTGNKGSLKGIEFFTELTTLKTRYASYVDVSFSSFAKLQTVKIGGSSEYLYDNNKEWDFSECGLLKDLTLDTVMISTIAFPSSIEVINITCAPQASLVLFPVNVTNCQNLKSIKIEPNGTNMPSPLRGTNNKPYLETVDIPSCYLNGVLDFSGDTALQTLKLSGISNVSSDQQASLNLAGCTSLTELNCTSSYNFTGTLDLSTCSSLTAVYCRYTCFTGLILGEANSSLAKLLIYGPSSKPAIESINLTTTPILAYQFENYTPVTNHDTYYGSAACDYYSYGDSDSRAALYCDIRTTVTNEPYVGPPVITSQPQDVTVPVNTTAHFYITATGEDLQYEWQVSVDGVWWTPRPGWDTGTDAWIYATADTDGYRFRCRVYNNGGEVISDAAILTVGDPVTDPPTITTNPVDQTVNLGESATFSVVASGRHLLYQWEKSTDGGTTWSDYQGLVYSSFTFTPRTSDTGNKYRCKVWNEIGTVYSNAATLTVTSSPSDTPPTITKHPTQVLVEEGTTALFSVTATGDNLTYQWQTYSNGSWTDIRNATASTYSFTASLSENGKQYRCKVFNSAGTVYSNAATLTVEAAESLVAPTVTRQPASEEADEGENVTFTVEASGEDLTYQWQTLKNGTWYPISGANGSSHTVSASASLNNSRYRCQISNQAGTVYSNAATLTVNQTPSLAPPTIKYNPQSRQVKEGTVVSFSVTAVGSSMTYQWQTREGTTWYPISGATEPTYSVSANLSMNGKQYRCVVTNEAGAATSTAATLTVNPLPDPTPTPTPTPEPVRPQSRKYWMINGLDILPYVIEGGIKWSRNDVDGDNAGRVIGNADMTRDRLAIKMRCDISCRPLFWQDINKILQAIKPEFVTVQYNDPMEGSVTRIMYSNNATATLGTIYDDDTELYEDLTFPLIEK